MVVLVCECGYDKTNQMSRHLRTCKIRRKLEEHQRRIQLEEHQRRIQLEEQQHRVQLEERQQRIQLEERNAQLEERNVQLEKQIAELNGRLDEARKSRSVKNNVKNNNNVNIINIVPFGKEPMPDTKEILDLLNKPESSLSRYIELKHFREPNTANVRLSSKRAKTMQVLEKDVNEQLRWIEKDKAAMLEDIAEKNIEELVDTHNAEQNDRWKQWYSTMPEEGFDKTETWKRAVGSIENMLISQSR